MSSDEKILKISSESEEPKHNYGLILCILLLSFIAILVALLWMFQPPNEPNVHVDDATLTRFTILPPNNTLYYNLIITMRFRNDNRFLKAKYDNIVANATYQGHRFGTSEIEGFHLGPKKENGHVGIEFKGEQRVDLDNIQTTKYELEIKNGVYEIYLELSLKSTYKAMWVSKDRNNLRCRFKVPLCSEGKVSSITKFESTQCF